MARPMMCRTTTGGRPVSPTCPESQPRPGPEPALSSRSPLMLGQSGSIGPLGVPAFEGSDSAASESPWEAATTSYCHDTPLSAPSSTRE